MGSYPGGATGGEVTAAAEGSGGRGRPVAGGYGAEAASGGSGERATTASEVGYRGAEAGDGYLEAGGGAVATQRRGRNASRTRVS